MLVTKNEFDFYVNCFYQAAGLIKKVPTKGLMDDVDFLPEINALRNQLKQIPEFNSAIQKANAIGKVGLAEFDASRFKLKNDYNLNDDWLQELFDSIDIYVKKRNDMSSYRISFQMAAETVCKIMSNALPQINNDLTKKDAISFMLDQIFYQDYWAGEDVIQDIKFVRSFKSLFNLSDKWILEYVILVL